MLNTFISIFQSISNLGEKIWDFFLLSPSELYGDIIETPLLQYFTELSDKVLANGGGDRNPLTGLAYGFLDETVTSWLEFVISAPRMFFETVLPFPMIAILFGGGLIVCLIYRLVSWIIDVLP